ncbi:MAG: PQQ-dependent sugar dehydrogenase [Chloroflexota bacterium]
MRFKIMPIMVVVLSLVACSAAATPQPTPINRPLATATPSPLAPAPSPTRSATPTARPSPTVVLSGSLDHQTTPVPLQTPSGTHFDPETMTVRLEPVAAGLRAPTFATHANDGSGRLFVVEKAGTIRSVRAGAVAETPFLDITLLVRSNDSERGLLGLAFHPQYKRNGLFYVHYTDQDGDIIVARYAVSSDPNRANPDSAVELLHIRHRDAANHNGGQLAFGPDGYLYIGTGDGGASGDRFGNSQNPSALLAKLLRIDVNSGTPYGIPKDNPFANRAGFRPEIWAWGLRNPWRFAFDRATGDLYIADVGQNAWEEVDFQPAKSKGGENYGWNKLEGTHCYPPNAPCDPAGFVAPVAEYSHANGDCSITGGYVYRGTAQPVLTGTYFFADYCTGHMWALQRDANGGWLRSELLTTRFAISSFGEDEQGEVYVLGFGNGNVYRVVAVAK